MSSHPTTGPSLSSILYTGGRRPAGIESVVDLSWQSDRIPTPQQATPGELTSPAHHSRPLTPEINMGGAETPRSASPVADWTSRPLPGTRPVSPSPGINTDASAAPPTEEPARAPPPNRLQNALPGRPELGASIPPQLQPAGGDIGLLETRLRRLEEQMVEVQADIVRRRAWEERITTEHQRFVTDNMDMLLARLRQVLPAAMGVGAGPTPGSITVQPPTLPLGNSTAPTTTSVVPPRLSMPAFNLRG